jgi:AAA+ superfamily predicted ATPase
MQELLSLYIESLRPILYIEDVDFYSIDRQIQILADSCGAKVKEFSMGYGEIKFNKGNIVNEKDLSSFLDAYKDAGYGCKNLFLLLKDVHAMLDDQKIIARLRYIAERNMYFPDYRTTIFILTGVRHIPKELEHLITLVPGDKPNQPEIEEMLNNYAVTLGFPPKDIGELSLELKGLSRFQIKQIIDLAYCDGGYISLPKDKHRIIDEKKQIIEKSGILEFIKPDDSLEDVGGLVHLKSWLADKAKIFRNLDKALKMGLDTPRGVLIIGFPGCGKSLIAKTTSDSFSVPLIRLDIGRLFGKYLGESENNMRQALRQAEAISPCVLWIDEIEKAFAGGNKDGHEVTVRLIGHFLTWMQEKKSTVFIVATANDIDSLRPEFLRKGRFDEIFSTDLPNWDERLEIIKIHQRKRNQPYAGLDFHSLEEKTVNFTGADINSAISTAVENVFIQDRTTVTYDDLAKAFEQTNPLYKLMSHDLDALAEMRYKIKKHNARKA